MKQGSFIAVEGPIGAGKTTLASMLSEELNIPIIKEIVEANPFLDKFYDNIDEWSFQTEMFFLCNRYKQLEDTRLQYIDLNKPVIADYHIYKNLIFSERTLTGVKRGKYRQIYHLLTDDLPKPNIILYIKADLDTLLQRIKKRGRSFEQTMDTAYLQQLMEDYDAAMTFLAKDDSTTVITIDGNLIDFVENREQFVQIASNVKEFIQ
ncbi:deoxynucleoside kinase [Paenibacillus sp. IHBB 10380]|uniref:deoxynucleoside kinase n=1 Tax=Paenibacillus sp. IHBB 10380 TaxID=1566358 RepID=UPI0005CFB5D1|nr:deoxynucleoside kinase [Paenibacillus sp. IHBB 10380]AJS59637.1 deoxyguanosine kinase [Paenibacillus sp. IHBB 10380]